MQFRMEPHYCHSGLSPMEELSNIETRKERFLFKGDASDYFGIWIVNNTLTWVTLGLYSPWAKVRTLQFFQGNTELAGGRFQFTANPLTILRSRIIAVALMALYIVVSHVDSTLANIVLGCMILAFFVCAPILTILVMSFRLRYSEWRGISFRFNKDYAGAYRVYLLPNFFLGMILLCLLLPFNSIEVEDALGIERYKSHYYDDEWSDEELLVEEASDDAASESSVNTSSANDAPTENPDINSASADSSEGFVQDGAVDDESSLYTEEHEFAEEDYPLSDDEYASEEDGYIDEEDEEQDSYINPYLFIPSGVFFLLFLGLMPYFDFINTRFLSRNVRLGTAPFCFSASAGDYYRFYCAWFIVTAVFVGLWVAEINADALENSGLFGAMVVATIMYFPGSFAYLKSRRYNVLLSNTIIDNKHRLNANTPFSGMLFLMLTNSLAIFFTFGLMKPWAQVRTLCFMLKYSSLEVHGSLDEFVTAQKAESSAIGEEIADVFEMDLIA